MNVIFTIGYGNLAIIDFVAFLRRREIEILVDVRSRPYSRNRPDYRKKELEAYLDSAGIEYRYMGDCLGGIPSNPDLYDRSGQADYNILKRDAGYKNAIEDLIELARKKRVCLMCAEFEPWRCHRGLLISETLRERKAEVCHIMPDGGLVKHENIREKFGDNQGRLF